MNVAELRRTQALALELSAELNEAAEELATEATKPNVRENELFDFVFRTVNDLKEKLNQQFTEHRITSYEQAVNE